MNTVCERCGRLIQRPNEHALPFGGPAGHAGGERLYFVHDWLGCDTGCCGHKFYVVDKCGRVVWSNLMLDEHRWDTLACQAAELAWRFGVVVDWPACDYFSHEARPQALARRCAI
jgi:hypothetical protein